MSTNSGDISRSTYECIFYTKRLGLRFKFLRNKAIVAGYDEAEFLAGIEEDMPRKFGSGSNKSSTVSNINSRITALPVADSLRIAPVVASVYTGTGSPVPAVATAVSVVTISPSNIRITEVSLIQ
jgi:hypothetical protein